MRARLSFQNLNTFATAAEVLSFQEAAELLHVTPSAVSHQIRSLEASLGYPLFERLDKRVRLTNRGRQLFLEIREPLKQLHQASRNALHGSEDNALALSVAPVFATRWLLPRLKNFRARYPEISLSVIAAAGLVDFRSDPFDAAIRMGNGHWPDTVSKRLFGKRIVAVCHPNLIMNNGGSTLSDIRMVAIKAEDAIGLVDRSFVSDEINEGRLVLACDHVLSGDGGYFLTYPESASERTSLQLFEQWIFSQADTD